MTVVTLIALLIAIAALITLLPYRAAKKKSIIGYKALCPFAPISTFVLLMAAGIIWLIGSLI